MPTKKKRDYHHGNLRAELVEAAIAIADEEGIEALSTRAVARRLDVSHAAPARHFANREALLAEVATAAFERFTEDLSRSVSPRKKPERVLADLGRAYVRFALEHPGLMRLMFSPEVSDPAVPHERLRQASGEAYDVLRQAVHRTMPAAPGARVEVATFFAWTSAHGAAMLWLDGPMRHFFEADAKERFLELADAMLRESAHAIAAMDVHAKERES